MQDGEHEVEELVREEIKELQAAQHILCVKELYLLIDKSVNTYVNLILGWHCSVNLPDIRLSLPDIRFFTGYPVIGGCPDIRYKLQPYLI